MLYCPLWSEHFVHCSQSCAFLWSVTSKCYYDWNSYDRIVASVSKLWLILCSAVEYLYVAFKVRKFWLVNFKYFNWSDWNCLFSDCIFLITKCFIYGIYRFLACHLFGQSLTAVKLNLLFTSVLDPKLKFVWLLIIKKEIKLLT